MMSGAAPLPGALQRRFEALVFDWDGTAVPDRAADAGAVRRAIEAGCALGLEVMVVSGTHVENIDGQLAARPRGPGELHLLLNRGSEVFRVGPDGVELLHRRVASAREDAALDRAAALTVERLGECGLEARIVSQRLNRRKIDLIPLPEWADPPKARIAELLEAVQARLHEHAIDGLRAAGELGQAAALDAGLTQARVSSDAKHIEIGLTDKSDSACWCFTHLWRRGVWPEQALILGDELGPLGGLPGSDSRLLIDAAASATVASVGVEPAGVPAGVIALGGGPAEFLALFEAQLESRRRGALPIVPSDPHWTLQVRGVDHERERASESLLTLADGRLGTRGSVLVPGRASTPGVVMAGTYRGRGELSELQPAPLWNRLAPPAGGEDREGMEAAERPKEMAGEEEQARAGEGAEEEKEEETAAAEEEVKEAEEEVRTLDLHAGLLAHRAPGGLAALELSSLAEPGIAVLRALGSRGQLAGGPPLVAPADVQPQSELDGTLMRITLDDGLLEAAGTQSLTGAGELAALERIAAYVASSTSSEDSNRPALRRMRRAQAAGVEQLLIDHRRAWAERWEQADVRVDGDPELQLAVRLALYHLMGSVADGGEAAVGARGLSGQGYRGHVFWDSDVFVLPFLAATHPRGARAILEYRVRRLPAARAAARAAGRRGARFAWESAADGTDVTPRAARDRAGREVAIYTGQREEHIVADVAWAVGCYMDWTGDEAFRTGAGRELLVETARYWASRIERDQDGRAHIRGVIGPDEYHEQVDDNAYTNVMARWNLRRAATETTGGEIDLAERASWLDLADALIDGYAPDTGRHEQFAGFYNLEPLVIAELAPRRPIAADLLLGPERVHGAQVVKQADVLMLHHLIPEELAPGSLAADLEFYEPRTAHGSSLSPGIHAGLLARVGRLADAQAALKLAARIDLDDISAATAAGVHIAAMGSVWQALVYGFAGVRLRGGVLVLDPRLPAGWEALELRLCVRGANLRVRVTEQQIGLDTDQPLRVSIAGAEPVSVGADGLRSARFSA